MSYGAGYKCSSNRRRLGGIFSLLQVLKIHLHTGKMEAGWEDADRERGGRGMGEQQNKTKNPVQLH